MKQISTPISSFILLSPRRETLELLRALARFVTPQTTAEEVALFRRTFSAG